VLGAALRKNEIASDVPQGARRRISRRTYCFRAGVRCVDVTIVNGRDGRDVHAAQPQRQHDLGRV
jgi:hypothetical protein